MAYQLRKRKPINNRKRIRISDKEDEIYKYPSQTPYVEIEKIEERLEINGFSTKEIIHSCITKFKNELKSMKNGEIMNELFNEDFEKLKIKEILRNIQKGIELKKYINSYFQELIYDLSLYYVNYELTYILNELNKIRNKMINNSYNEEMIILTRCCKILVYYIFMNTIEQEKEEKRKNEPSLKKVKKNK